MPNGQSGTIIIAQKIQGGGIQGSGGHVGERKERLIKHNVPRDNNPVGVKIKTQYPLWSVE
jgi:hypothetical protein